MAQKTQGLSCHLFLYWPGGFMRIFLLLALPLVLAGCFCDYHLPVFSAQNTPSMVQSVKKGSYRKNYFSHAGMDICNSNTAGNNCRHRVQDACGSIWGKSFLLHLCYLYHV